MCWRFTTAEAEAANEKEVGERTFSRALAFFCTNANFVSDAPSGVAAAVRSFRSFVLSFFPSFR